MENQSTSVKNGSWDEDFPKQTENKKDSSGGDRKKAKYMDLSKPGRYLVRIVGNYVSYFRRWTPEVIENHTTHLEYKDKDPFWKAGFRTPKRFAIHVIDRADGEIKILDKGPGIFEEFAKYKRLKGINPAGKDGPNFFIEVKIPMKNGKPDKKNTEYSVMPDEKTPLTEAELEKLKAEKYPLQDIYKPDPIEKILDIWERTPEDKKIAPSRESKFKSDKTEDKQTKTEAKTETKVETKKEEKKVEDKTENDDELFENKDSGGKSESGELF